MRIFTGQPFTALDQSATKILVELYYNGEKIKHWFPLKAEGKDILLLGFAETIFRYQGQTMEDEFTIHNGDSMTFEAMLTAITRPRHHSHIKFSNIKSLKNKTFESAYANQKVLKIPSKFSEYKEVHFERVNNNNNNKTQIKKYESIKPMINNEMCEWILYQITDINNLVYDGITQLKDNNIDASLKNRLLYHRQSMKLRRNTRVHEMNKPIIIPYYNQPKPTLIFGTRQQAENIEQSHIRNDLIKYGENLINKFIKNLPKTMNNEEIEEVNQYRNQIEEILNKCKIIAPTKAESRYRFNNKKIATALNLQKEIKESTFEDIQERIERGIMKVVFNDGWQNPKNIELMEQIKEEYKNENKFLKKPE